QRRLMEVHSDILFSFSNLLSDTHGKQIHRMLDSWRRGVTSWDQVLGPGLRFSSSARLPAGFSDFNFHVGDLSCWEMADWYFSTLPWLFGGKGAGAAWPSREVLRILGDGG